MPSYKQFSKKFTSRNSPPYPAKHFASGSSKRGNDGTMYVVSRPNINGVKRWLKKTPRRPSSSVVTEIHTRDPRRRGAPPPVPLQPSFHQEFPPPIPDPSTPPARPNPSEMIRIAQEAVRARQQERARQIGAGW